MPDKPIENVNFSFDDVLKIELIGEWNHYEQLLELS